MDTAAPDRTDKSKGNLFISSAFCLGLLLSAVIDFIFGSPRNEWSVIGNELSKIE